MKQNALLQNRNFGIQGLVRTILQDGTPRSALEMLGAVLELGDSAATHESLQLLMRLDPHLKQVDAEKWTIIGQVSTKDQRIVELTQQFLDRLPSPGAMMNSVVKDVAVQTGYGNAEIWAVIAANFHVSGKAVFNKRKENG